MNSVFLNDGKLNIGIIILDVILIVLMFLAGILLNYGMVACVLATRRGEKVTWLTIFKKIKERIGKVFSVLGCVMLETVILAIILAAIYLLNIFILKFSTPFIIDIIIQIVSIVGTIYFLVKLLYTWFSQIIANYIIYAYPDKSG